MATNKAEIRETPTPVFERIGDGWDIVGLDRNESGHGSWATAYAVRFLAGQVERVADALEGASVGVHLKRAEEVLARLEELREWTDETIGPDLPPGIDPELPTEPENTTPTLTLSLDSYTDDHWFVRLSAKGVASHIKRFDSGSRMWRTYPVAPGEVVATVPRFGVEKSVKVRAFFHRHPCSEVAELSL